MKTYEDLLSEVEELAGALYDAEQENGWLDENNRFLLSEVDDLSNRLDEAETLLLEHKIDDSEPPNRVEVIRTYREGNRVFIEAELLDEISPVGYDNLILDLNQMRG